MDVFDEPFWNLDQVRAWALSREKGAVSIAATPATGIVTNTVAAINVATVRGAERQMRNGRDINEELWAASGWSKSNAPARLKLHVHPIAAEVQALHVELAQRRELDRQLVGETMHKVHAWRSWDGDFGKQVVDAGSFGLAILDDRLRALVLAALNARPPHGPFQERVVFPINEYLTHLLRLGRLASFAQATGGLDTRELTRADWAGLSVDYFGDPQRLCAVKTQARSIAQIYNGKFPSIEAFGTVRLLREDVLKEFLDEAFAATVDLVAVLRNAANQNAGFLSQTKAFEIARQAGATESREKIRETLETVQGKQKPGPKRPRKNRAAPSA